MSSNFTVIYDACVLYLDTLLKQGLTQTVGQLREWKVAI